MEKGTLSLFMMTLMIVGSFAPFATSAQASANAGAEGFTGGDYSTFTNNYQTSRPSFGDFYSGSSDRYWPILNNLKEDQCDAENSDFIIGIPPGGCEPMVVRSDLLAEQNVPVFCQLSAIRVNPLIDVSTIKSISFSGDYPEEVAGISFHPARAAVKSYRTLLGDPIEENIGYVVIVLKDQPDESNLTETISGMLTAKVRYDAQGGFGTGSAEYYLEKVSNDNWNRDAAKSSFWSGNGYLRVKDIEGAEATIEVLSEKDNVYKTITLKEGETSKKIYTPGQYCTAAMRLKLNKIDNSEDMAKIDIDGDTFWVRKGSKLLGGKCSVKDLNVFPGGSGTVDISCTGNSQFTLVLKDSRVQLNNGTEDIAVGIGGNIKGIVNEKAKNIYLGYYGKQANEDIGNFVILFNITKTLTEDDVSLITRIFDVEEFEDVDEMKRSLDRSSKFKDHYEIVKVGETGGYGITVVSIGLDTASVAGYPDSTNIPQYLSKMDETISELVDTFPSEKSSPESTTYYGEDALHNAITLAGDAKDRDLQINLIKKFLTSYPDSKNVENMRDMKMNLENYDHQGSSAYVFVNNDNYNVRVDGFQSGSGASDSVDLAFGGGTTHNLKRDRVYDENFDEIEDVAKIATTVPRLTVSDIDGKGAKISYRWSDVNDKGKNITSKPTTINIGESVNIGGINMRVADTHVREVAYVSLLPEVRNTETKANFTFNIEVEERAFEISPERARRKIDDLNRSINDWEDRVNKLGDLVKGMKTACLATSTFLTLKSFLSGFSGGTAAARGDVMDRYEAKCKKNYPELDLNVCYSSKYKDEIETAVDTQGGILLEVNDIVEKCTDKGAGVKSDFFNLNTEIVDNKKYVGSLRDCTDPRMIGTEFNMIIDGQDVKVGNLNSAGDFQAALTYKQACSQTERDNIDSAGGDSAKLYKVSQELSVPCQIATNKLTSSLRDNVDVMKAAQMAKDMKVRPEAIISTPPGTQKAYVVIAKEDNEVPYVAIKKGNYYAIAPLNNIYYVVNLTKRGSGSLELTEVYTQAGTQIKPGNTASTGAATKTTIINTDGTKTESTTVATLDTFNEIKKAYTFVAPSGSSCSNVMIKPYVKYYESGNKQGFAAVVPVDKNQGWYAYIDNKYYAENGIPSAFELCNVGPDGLLGEGQKSGDVCQLFQNSVAERTSISCGGFDLAKMYKKAEIQIRDANRNGNGVNLDGTFVGKSTPLGPESSAMECTDFMSVTDCNTMFNVCDPVICPSSRCDLGGKWPVSDVVASGIIGSIALCLPNRGKFSEGGVVIPVCLSGIHAGLDAYVSLLRSHRDCLIERVETGRYTGICDEITAVYTCQFFWGQFAPIMDVLLTKVIGGAYGNGLQTRGGAEYMTVQKAFDNLESSVDYMTKDYMTNAFRAFELKNTEEVGDTVCKGFIGTSFPTSADALDSFLEPESPTQFNAHFQETPFSDATVPATSHYKVFYHIYAGNDRGAQYRIYLKSPPETSYYASSDTLLVESGYVDKGTEETESSDFTAPSGYKELCVSINGNDECGFKSVTSSFGLNYATQAYAADQATDKGIETTENCITTSTSGWGLVNINIQAGVEDTIGGDDISTSGIVRICASTNPDKGVVFGNDVYCKTESDSKIACDPGYTCQPVEGSDFGLCEDANSNSQVSQGRWIDVGYCDNEGMTCWLDSLSVKDNLGQYMAVNDLTVSELVRSGTDLKAIETQDQYQNVAAKLEGLNKDIDGITKETSIDELISGGEETEKIKLIVKGLDEISGSNGNVGQGTNAAKARALIMKADVYAKIVRALLVKYPDVTTVGGQVATTESSSADEGVVSGGDILYKDLSKIVSRATSEGILNSKCTNYIREIHQTVDKYENIDALMLFALMQQESGCDNSLNSVSDAHGLMQIVSFDACKDIGNKTEIISEFDKNIECGASILNQRYSGDAKSYNCDAFNSDNQNEPAISKSYSGIERALRYYNGWGCAGYRKDRSEIHARQGFVEQVVERYNKLIHIMNVMRIKSSGADDKAEEVPLFVVEQTGATSLYFRFKSNSWEWSPDKTTWMSVSTTEFSGGQFKDGYTIATPNLQIILDLREAKNLDDGIRALQKTPGDVDRLEN